MREKLRPLIATLFCVLLIDLLLASAMDLDLLGHNPYDSYTRQALAWREGRVCLDEDYSWLELALYKDKVFVSFPPFPSLLMLPLTFIFGGNTPNLLVNMLLFAGSACFAYALSLRLGQDKRTTAAMAVFWVCGCDLLELCLNGGVWNIAQGCGFFMTIASLYCMEAPPEKSTRAERVMGPVLIAFAVGCRPFQAVYVPYVLYKLYFMCDRKQGFFRTIARMIPYVVLPACVAAAYGAYNYVRFDNIFEFGHNYLPEFSTEGGKQFSVSHWFTNVKNIFRLPYFTGNRLEFPRFYGFAFYLCNPVFLMALIETVRRLIRREFDAADAILTVSFFVHMNLLLLHRTFGGLQFGCRYTVDLVPALGVFVLRKKRRLTLADCLIMIWGVLFNIYGTALFHLGS